MDAVARAKYAPSTRAYLGRSAGRTRAKYALPEPAMLLSTPTLNRDHEWSNTITHLKLPRARVFIHRYALPEPVMLPDVTRTATMFLSDDDSPVSRGAWARVTIRHFRHLALQTV